MNTNTSGPLAALIARTAAAPWLTLLFVAALAVWGYMAMRASPLDAIPDLSDTQVIIYSDWPGRSPSLVEDQLTYPISTALLAAPRIKTVRGQSFFGASYVYAIFEDGVDLYWARSRVVELLAGVRANLPNDVNPTLGPDASGVGWVFQYALTSTSGQHSLADLRSLQDWHIRYALASVPGVAEVASVGGYVKEYQVQIDPQRLTAYGVSLPEVIEAVRRANGDAGGHVLELAGHEHMLRGRGYIQSVSDLENIPLRVGAGGVPLTLKSLANVALAPGQRRGAAEWNGEGESVGGIVVMRSGENALDVIAAVKARLKAVRQSLPAGVDIQIAYDRSELITAAIHTLRQTLLEEMLVVSLVIFLFLLSARSALIPILMLPTAVLLAFIPMVQQQLTANIMSLGGIAVAIGAMVDAAIVMIENIHKKLEDWQQNGRQGSRQAVIVSAMQEVGPAIFYSLLVITVSFLPVFTLLGAEGRLFKPLALTKTYAMGFAAVLAVTAVPALAALLLRADVRGENDNPLNRWLITAYEPVVRWVVRHPRLVLAIAAGLFLATIPAYLVLKREFMPPLNEGVILYMPTSPPGMGMSEATAVLQAMDRELKAFPEVQSVFGKIGRAKTATDSAPLGMVETTIVLKPRNQWRPGMTWSKLIAELDASVRYPGMPNIWWMPVQTRTEMLATGIRSPLGIQIFGNDLAQLERTAIAIEQVVAKLPDTRNAYAERVLGGYYIDVVTRRQDAARYGLNVADVHETLETLVGGMPIAETLQARERYPISLRLAPEFRDTPEALARVPIATQAGMRVPLAAIADIRHTQGPDMLRSEAGQLVVYVLVDTDQPIADYVDQARLAVEREVALPAGVRVEWTGQFKYYERAKAQLSWVAPLTLFLIVLLLYLNTRSWSETGIVLLAVPFSLIGAVWLLWLLDYNISVAVWVGIIALAGLDAETGVVMLLYLKLAHQQRQQSGRLQMASDLEEAIVEGAARRLRPKLMTVLTTMIGLAPILWSDGVGADVMKRIAAPMVGGLITSYLLELTVYPAIFALWKGVKTGTKDLKK